MNKVEVLNFEKNNNKKVFLICLVFVLIIFFGAGLYFFLRFAKEHKKIDIKNDIVELGTTLNKDIRHYMDGNTKNCKINLDGVDTNKIGKYKYSIKCGKITTEAKIEVKDTQAPTMELKIVNIAPSKTYAAKDFVLSSNDLSDFTIAFKDEENTKKTSDIGMHLVPIVAKDIYGNESEDQGILIVSEVVSDKYMVASKEIKTNYDASLKVIDKIGINYVNFFNNAIRIYEYKFNDESDYEKAINEYQEKSAIENNSGEMISIEQSKTIKIIKMINREELDGLNGYFPYTYNDIITLYNKLGYAISTEK